MIDLLDHDTTWQLLTPGRCEAAVEQSLRAISDGSLEVPLRSFLPMSDGGALTLMPATARDDDLAGAKILSLMPKNPRRGAPAVQGLVVLFSAKTGTLSGLVDGAAVTARRTAAASAIASRLLARSDARSHGILGTGVQAYSHALAIQHSNPSLSCVKIWGRNARHAQDLAERLVSIHSMPASAAELDETASCDIVSAVTASPTPLIEDRHLRRGMHINLVGSHQPDRREATSEVVAAARLFVEHRTAALCEAGDILLAIADGAITAAHICGELGDVLLGRCEGRVSDTVITLFKSLGNSGEDLYAAAAALKAARLEGKV
jgi:ornithine cyclodeaminase